MSKLQGVIFDLDGVLTYTSRQHFQAWQELSKTLGYHLSEQVNERLKGISRLESLEIVLEAGNLAGKFSNREKQRLAEQKNAFYQQLIQRFTRENLAEGALELLKALKEKDIKLGLASVSHNARFLLEAMDIEKYFDAVADPKQVKQGKPAPDIFLLAANQLKVRPEQCIGVEDAYAGIQAIISAGMTAVGVGSRQELSNCKTVVQSLAELNPGFMMNLFK